LVRLNVEPMHIHFPILHDGRPFSCNGSPICATWGGSTACVPTPGLGIGALPWGGWPPPPVGRPDDWAAIILSAATWLRHPLPRHAPEGAHEGDHDPAPVDHLRRQHPSPTPRTAYDHRNALRAPKGRKPRAAPGARPRGAARRLAAARRAAPA